MKTFLSALAGFIIGALFTSALFYSNQTVTVIEEPEPNIEQINVVSEDESALIESIEEVYDGVVLVENIDRFGYLLGTGTGFFYKETEEGYLIATNHHVVEDAASLNIIFADGTTIEDVELVGSDELTDLAVIKVDKIEEFKVLEIGDNDALKVGQSVFAIGSPLGVEYINSVTKGIISGLDRMLEDGDLLLSVIQTDTAINPGNSGGPLLTLNGEVIGINSLKLVQSEVEGMGFAIPMDEAIVYLESIENSGEVIRPTFGVRTLDVVNMSDAFREEYNISSDIETGILVLELVRNSGAARGGVQVGDVITELDGVAVDNILDFRIELYKHNAGDTVTVTVYRDGDYQELTINLDNTPLN